MNEMATRQKISMRLGLKCGRLIRLYVLRHYYISSRHDFLFN